MTASDVPAILNSYIPTKQHSPPLRRLDSAPAILDLALGRRELDVDVAQRGETRVPPALGFVLHRLNRAPAQVPRVLLRRQRGEVGREPVAIRRVTVKDSALGREVDHDLASAHFFLDAFMVGEVSSNPVSYPECEVSNALLPRHLQGSVELRPMLRVLPGLVDLHHIDQVEPNGLRILLDAIPLNLRGLTVGLLERADASDAERLLA